LAILLLYYFLYSFLPFCFFLSYIIIYSLSSLELEACGFLKISVAH